MNQVSTDRDDRVMRPRSPQLRAVDYPALQPQLDARGYAVVPALLGAEQCRALRGLYAEPSHFRSRVVMSRHGFGSGEYQYFEAPLPEPVLQLRAAAYGGLVALANDWAARLNEPRRFPERLEELTAQCRELGQTRPTPLLLKYGPDDYNCLHQDLYGDLVFPLQLTVLLSQPGVEFQGGQFLLVEQRPRRQSRAEVVELGLGDAVVFAVRQRPVAGVRGDHRVQMRHGVSRVSQGERYALGVIFHDAA
jgi:hypothetical protein